MKVSVLFSGGKDSTYATWVAQHNGWDVVALLTVLPRNVESLMFHFPNAEWTRIQAEAMGLSHRIIKAGTDELSSLRDGLEIAKETLGIDGIVTGAVASDYQKSRIDQICDLLQLRSFAPLWHKDPRRIVDDLKTFGFKIVLSGVAATGLDESWLGQELTEDRWAELEILSKRHSLHLTGEGGEYETFVLDAPQFNKRVVVEEAHNKWDGQSGYLIIERAMLGDKLSN